MRIVEELSSFYRHIYLNLPGFTRLVGVAGAGAPLRFGVFPANLYKIGEPTSGLEPLTCSLRERIGGFRGVGGCFKTLYISRMLAPATSWNNRKFSRVGVRLVYGWCTDFGLCRVVGQLAETDHWERPGHPSRARGRPAKRHSRGIRD